MIFWAQLESFWGGSGSIFGRLWHHGRRVKNIKKLKTHSQEIIQLHYFQEKSYLEIAIQLQIPVNNVKVKLLRAKRLLAELISKKND